MALSPVFIIGVPRSGTTLLRVLLDSHSQIAALPESPWLLGAYGGDSSLRSLLLEVTDGPFGIVRNVSGIETGHVLAAGRRFLDELFEPFMIDQGKRVLVFKTPDDIPHLDFLMKLAPDAHYIHITRDGRDVCKSQLAKKGEFFQDLKGFGRLSYANVFRRWVEWEQQVRATLYRPGMRVCHIRYEDLIADPRGGMGRITQFLDVPFEPAMLDYAAARHDYPSWEAGSTDVSKRDGITSLSVGQWRTAYQTTEMRYTLAKHDSFLVNLGYPSSDLRPDVVERLKMAVFPLTDSIADRGWRIWRSLRKNARRRAESAGRAIAVVSMVALAAYLFLPFGPTPYQPVACFLTAAVFGLTFGPRMARHRPGRHGYEGALVKAAAILLAYVGALTLARATTSIGAFDPIDDKGAYLWRPDYVEFLDDALGVMIGVGAAWFAGKKAKGRLGRLLRGEVLAS